MWSIHTIEAEIPEGTHEFSIPWRNDEREAVILVENIGEEGAGLQGVQVQSNLGQQLSNYEKTMVFMGEIKEQIILKITTNSARLIRITIAMLRSGAKSFLKSYLVRYAKDL